MPTVARYRYWGHLRTTSQLCHLQPWRSQTTPTTVYMAKGLPHFYSYGIFSGDVSVGKQAALKRVSTLTRNITNYLVRFTVSTMSHRVNPINSVRPALVALQFHPVFFDIDRILTIPLAAIRYLRRGIFRSLSFL